MQHYALLTLESVSWNQSELSKVDKVLCSRKQQVVPAGFELVPNHKSYMYDHKPDTLAARPGCPFCPLISFFQVA